MKTLREFIYANFKSRRVCADHFNLDYQKLTRWEKANALVIDNKVYKPIAELKKD